MDSRLKPSHMYTVRKVINFPRYNMKCSGENVILHGIVHVVSGFPLHFMLYRGNLDCFSNRVGSSKPRVKAMQRYACLTFRFGQQYDEQDEQNEQKLGSLDLVLLLVLLSFNTDRKIEKYISMNFLDGA